MDAEARKSKVLSLARRNLVNTLGMGWQEIETKLGRYALLQNELAPPTYFLNKVRTLKNKLQQYSRK